MTFDAVDKLACALRELRKRKSAYPRWVREGRMQAEDAAREIATMAAIVEDYRVLARTETELPL